jgi:hypothetical protein
MTFEEKQIAAIRGATSDMQELNTKLDELLPPHLESIVLALILKQYDMDELESIYRYICANHNVVDMEIQQITDLLLDIERCQNEDCNEWNKSEDITHNMYYEKRCCPSCIRDL